MEGLRQKLSELAHRTAEEWLKQPEFAGVEIIDPDGWRRDGLSWYDSISRDEFERRMIDSSCRLPAAYLARFASPATQK